MSLCTLAAWLVVGVLSSAAGAAAQTLSALRQEGRVVFGDIPVPGAIVTATREQQYLETVTDREGVYRFVGLSEGRWTLRVRALGFAPGSRSVLVERGAPALTWRISMLSVSALVHERTGAAGDERSPHPLPSARAGSASTTPPSGQGVDQEPIEDAGTARFGLADALVITGSIHDGLASPFAQPSAFGNNRPDTESVHTGSFSILGGTSAWDARPFSFSPKPSPRPSYVDLDFDATFGRPFRLPGTSRDGYLFMSGERIVDDRVRTRSGLVPTLKERRGNFSDTWGASGRSVQISDPVTGQPFESATIPANRISPQAEALLAWYPKPNLEAGVLHNFQTPVVTSERRSRVQTRLSQALDARNLLAAQFSYRRTTSDDTTLFGFNPSRRGAALDARIRWSNQAPYRARLGIGYRFSRLANDVVPHFANVANVSANAGIVGNNQDPVNWGPPTLEFSGGLATLTDAAYSTSRDTTHAWSVDMGLSSRSRHSFRFGAGFNRHLTTSVGQPDARGRFLFTGVATGLDLADFLLGFPAASSVAFGDADRSFRGRSFHAFLNDDWRLASGLTVVAGIRWEYAAPLTERLDRLVNLDIVPGFIAAVPVTAEELVGSLTGRRYGRALVRSDRSGFQPRLGLAWRPRDGSSLIVRASYGHYLDASFYGSLAALLAHQPPLSTTVNVERSAVTRLTLASGFPAARGVTSNTYAVDPELRAGLARIWRVSLQHDLPWSLTFVTSYTGTAGSRLMRQSLPNTFPPGASNPCLGCPAGFVHLKSDGSSRRHAGQLAVRRRLRGGLAASVEYTLAKAVDDGVTFGGPSLQGATIAQDWLNLTAEHGRSRFDRRHTVTAEFEYAPGAARTALGERLVEFLFSGWMFTGQLTVGSGLPLTPVYLAPVPGTAVSGTIRANRIDTVRTDAPRAAFLNPAAYTAPEAGRWGTAGRHSVSGPAQFELTAGIGRSLSWGDRFTVDWRLEASNVLNRVTYAAVNMVVNTPLFGYPVLANAMRTVRMSLHVGF